MEPTNPAQPETAVAPGPDETAAAADPGQVESAGTGEPNVGYAVPPEATSATLDTTTDPATVMAEVDGQTRELQPDPPETNLAPAQPVHDEPVSTEEQAAEAVLTKVQPSDLNEAAGGVSEVVTGTPDRPESTRIVPPGEMPASARPANELLPAEQRTESQVAPTQVEGEQGLHGNADY